MKLIKLLTFSLISFMPLAMNATVTPSSTQYVIGNNAPINVTWSYNTGPEGAGTANSAQGIFINPQAREVLGVNNAVMTRMTIANQLITIPESIVIPDAIIDAAQQNNLNTIHYQRTFTIGTSATGGPAITTTDTLIIRLKEQSRLSIQRVTQRFDNQQLVGMIGEKESIRAIATIEYKNAGMFYAVWEVASPVGSTSRPIYQPLQTVRKFLGAGGLATIQSPLLPSQNAGNYLIRLTIKQPSINNALSPLRYTVRRNLNTPTQPLITINVAQPANMALLTPDTQFKWQAIPGAKAYQLEIYDQIASTPKPRIGFSEAEQSPSNANIHDRPPTTGMIVPGNTNQLTLSMANRQYLHSNERYFWRVVAIDKDGQMIGASGLKEFVTP